MTCQTEVPIRLRMQLSVLSKSYLISLNLLETVMQQTGHFLLAESHHKRRQQMKNAVNKFYQYG